MTYDNFKSHKKQGFTLSLEDTFMEKPKWEVKFTPLPSPPPLPPRNPFKG